MNFLSHYYFDRNTIDPNLVLGAVLPDLVKNANKTWNLHPEKNQEQFNGSEKLQSILCGWQKHLEIDRFFHNSSFFKEHTKALKTAFVPVLQLSPVRPSFLAHIALELLLDNLLITRDLIDAEQFYKHLKNSDRLAIIHFLELNSLQDAPQFLHFFDSFLEANYLHSYREAHKIMYALNRICMRIWENPLNETQQEQLTGVLFNYRQTLLGSFMNIFEDINCHLHKQLIS